MKAFVSILLAVAAAAAAGCAFSAAERASWTPREARLVREANIATPEGRAAAEYRMDARARSPFAPAYVGR